MLFFPSIVGSISGFVGSLLTFLAFDTPPGTAGPVHLAVFVAATVFGVLVGYTGFCVTALVQTTTRRQ